MKPHKAEDIQVRQQVSLKKIYTGGKEKIRIRRLVMSAHSVKASLCVQCGGSGIVLTTRRIGPGMVQQMRGPCEDCHGSGIGGGVKEESVVIEFDVERGASQGTRLRLLGEGNIGTDGERGDVVVTLMEEPHARFKRHGSHLLITQAVSLSEALIGASFSIENLEGKPVHLKTAPPHVIRPGSMFILPHEGLPVQGKRGTRGSLIVAFEVEFPADGIFQPAQIDALKRAFKSADASTGKNTDFSRMGGLDTTMSRSSAKDTQESCSLQHSQQELEGAWGHGNHVGHQLLQPLDRSVLEDEGSTSRRRQGHEQDRRERTNPLFNLFGNFMGRGKPKL